MDYYRKLFQKILKDENHLTHPFYNERSERRAERVPCESRGGEVEPRAERAAETRRAGVPEHV